MSTAREPRLSVVIVTHEGAGLVEACLASVARHAGPEVEVLVVDNASSDDTLARVHAHFPTVQCVALERNVGYGSACNAGAERARGRCLLVLNQDLELETDLAPALDDLEAQPELGLVGGRLAYSDGRLQPSMGFDHCPTRILLSWLVPPRLPWLGRRCARNEHDARRYERRQRGVEYVSGAMLLCRRSTWLELGGMDPELFMYVEDVDFCRRLRARGLRVDYEPALRAMHREASGKPWVGARALAWTAENYVKFTRKHHGRGWSTVVALLLGPVLVLRGLALFGYGVVRGSALHRAKGRSFVGVGALAARRAPR